MAPEDSVAEIKRYLPDWIQDTYKTWLDKEGTALALELERLAEDERPQRQAFRYVLGLILIRKKLMRYAGRRNEVVDSGEADTTEREIWELRLKGSEPSDPMIDLVNPGLGDDDIIELSEQLGDVLQGDL